MKPADKSPVKEFDFIVVGAGTAGCILAARLSESSTHSVALLEAGGEADSFWIHAPLGYGKLYDNPKYNWLYETEPELILGGSRTFQPRGKVLGGSGSINGSVYLRGQREDFDYWHQLGNTGWSYEEVLPYFKKAEDNERGPDQFYGVGGPMTIRSDPPDELSEAFLKAALQAGYTKNEHGFNGKRQDGFDYNQVAIRNGRRCSTADAYLSPARDRPNLEVITDALATRIVFDDGVARGIEFRQNGVIHTLSARREVIVAAGAYNSPQLLQVSGIGPEETLRKFDIPVIAPLRGVGENLQNHISVSMKFECSRAITVNDIVNNPLRRIVAGIQYLLFRNGALATSAFSVAGMIRTDPALPAPDVKLQLQKWTRTHSGRGKERIGLDRRSSFSVGVQLGHPNEQGTVRIRAPDTAVAPAIHFNYTFPDGNQQAVVIGMQAVRKIVTASPMNSLVVRELEPGLQYRTDAELKRFFCESARPSVHPTSTCKMGVDDMAVVDPRLRVRSVKRLRVIDASIMPRIVAANTNATTVMIAEKGAAMVLEDIGA